MIVAGIDVSKEKSTVCVMNHQGEILRKPYDITHTKPDLDKLCQYLRSFEGKDEVRVVLEETSVYHLPVVTYLRQHSIFICAVNPLKMKKYRADFNYRGVKTDVIDAVTIANYGIEKWYKLQEYKESDDVYKQLKVMSRQYESYLKPHTHLTQYLDHLIDQVMPGIKDKFDGYNPITGKDPLSDFVVTYIHYSKITSMSLNKFMGHFAKWAKKKGYRPHVGKAESIYQLAKEGIPTLDYDEITKATVKAAVTALRELNKVLFDILARMRKLAKNRPEYDMAKAFKGVGDTLAPLLVAEVGDPRRYHSADALIACAGVDVPPYESGKFSATERKITKKGNSHLRRVGYLIIQSIVKVKPSEDSAVYDFYLKKLSEGKHKKTAKVAALNKFLRIYYARCKEIYSQIN